MHGHIHTENTVEDKSNRWMNVNMPDADFIHKHALIHTHTEHISTKSDWNECRTVKLIEISTSHIKNVNNRQRLRRSDVIFMKYFGLNFGTTKSLN